MKLRKFLILLFAAIGISAVAVCLSSCLFWGWEFTHCSHDNYSDWEYITDNCTETEQKRTCPDCGMFETRSSTTPRGHTYAVAEDKDDCVKRTQKLVCAKCSYSKTVTLKSHGHNYVNGRCEYCDAPYNENDPVNLDKYNGTYGYDYFEKTNVEQAELYVRIDEKVRAFHLNTDIDAEYVNGVYVAAQISYGDLGLDEDAAVAVWKTYRDDNPLFYWLSSKFFCNYDSLYLIAADDYAQGSKRAAANEFIYNKITEFSNKTRLGDNAYRLALAFHDAIIEATDYAYDEDGRPESADWAHSIMGTFTGRGGVCESYAKTFQLLLNYNGVENIFVTGQGGNQAHAWNMVKLDDGNWYWCDLTWDDTPNWEWGISYYYFLVNDTQNVSWRDAGWTNPEISFLYSHTPGTPEGKTANFLYTLPARAAKQYSESGLTLRKTFTDGNMTYAVAGYNTVQLTASEATGAVTIPETVTYDGVTYTVISIGGINDGLFLDGYVISRETSSLSIPKTVKYIWGSAFGGSMLEEFAVDGDNEWYCSVDGVLFIKSMKILVSYPVASHSEEYRIPDTVEKIEYGAFGIGGSNFPYLSKLYIGANAPYFGMARWGSSYDNPTNHISGEEQNIAHRLCGQGEIIYDSVSDGALDMDVNRV